MAKIKINTKQISEIVKTRYEIVSLVGIVVVALVCLVLGSLKFLGATDPEPKIIDAKKKIENLRASAPLKLNAKDAKKIRDTNEWPAVEEYPLLPGYPYFESGAAGENRREQPRILMVDSGPKAIQWNYVQSGVYTFDLRQSDGTLNVVKNKDVIESYFFNVQAKRMIIVAGSFPYLDQCEQFKKALRLDTIHELFSKGLAPTFEGIIVERCEVGADGKEGEWKRIYGYDVKDGKGVVAEPIQNLLKTCLYDEKNAEDYADVIYGPTVTPLPMLVRGEYPEIKIGGFETRPAIGKVEAKSSFVRGPIGVRRGHFELTPMPRRFGDDAPPPKLDPVDIDKLPQIIKDQFNGQLNWFDPHGQFIKRPDEEGKEGDPKDGKQPDDKFNGPDKFKGKFKDPYKFKQPGPGYPPTFNESPNPRQPSALPPYPKALIRFVDVDVEPGKAYKYRFKLRIANPNYGQSTKVVLNSEFAKVKEFETPGWAITETINIPRDYFFYVANYPTIRYQGKDHPKIYSYAGGAGGNSREIDLKAQDKVAFQIHTFIDSFTDDELKKHQVSDWLVAERVLVGRGEPIGRKVEVEVIEWNKYKNMFEISFNNKPDKKLEKAFPGFKKGIGVDFSPKNQIILLDFVGGHKHPVKGGSMLDESAAEVLLLMPDNSLIVRNSRDDMNDEGWDSKLASSTGHVYGVERRKRFEAWRERLEKLRKEEKGEKAPP